MQKFIKRFALHISSISLFLALAAPANALLPAVLLAGLPEAAVWGSALFHAAVVGAIAYYSLGGSDANSHKVNSTSGDIGRTANVSWVEFDKDSKSFKTMQSPVSVKVPFSTIKTKAENNLSKFPKLKSAMTQDGYINENSISSTNPSSAVGSTVTVSPTYPYSIVAGKSYRLDSYKGATDSWNSQTNTGTLFSNLTRWYDVSYLSGVFSYITYTYVRTDYGVPKYNKHTVSYYATEVVATPVSGSSTPSQFSAAISSSGSITDSAVQSEIDEMIKEYDNDNYSFSILDTPSASTAAASAAYPLSLPASALSSSQVNQIKSDQAYKDSVSQAWKNYSTTKSPADAQKYLDSVAADASNTAQKDTITDAIKKYDEEQKAAMKTPSSLSLPDSLKNPVPDGNYYGYLQLDRFNSVASSLLTKQPFAYLSSAKSYLTNWSSGQGAPVFTFDFPLLGQSHLYTVDLSPWDGTAKVIRYLFGIGGLVGLGAYFRGLLAGGRS